MSGHETFDEAVAAYALDVLSPAERATFESHLTTCDICQRTLADLRHVSVGIGLATQPEAPPESLRARTLAAAVAHPQERSLATSRQARVLAAQAARSLAPGEMQAGWSAPAWLALAASLVAVVGLSVYAWGLRSQLTTARDLLGDMSARVEMLRAQLAGARLDSAKLANTLNVLRAPNVLRVDLRTGGATTAATARAFLSADAGLVFNSSHLPALAPNRTYQLWVITKETPDPISAGTFEVDPSGGSGFAVPLPKGIGTIAAVAISVEPTGGSPKPTTTPILVGKPVNN